jgi:hypothetical protein
MSEKHVIVSYSHVWEIVSKNSINFPWGPLSGLLIWNLKSNTISKSQSQEQNGTVTSFLTPPQQEINNRQRHNKYREEQRYPGPRKKSLKFPLPGLYPFYELPLRGSGTFQSLSMNYKLISHISCCRAMPKKDAGLIQPYTKKCRTSHTFFSNRLTKSMRWN